jgi:hypothetical protein
MQHCALRTSDFGALFVEVNVAETFECRNIRDVSSWSFGGKLGAADHHD